MGLLSKLLGNNSSVEKLASDLIGNLIKDPGADYQNTVTPNASSRNVAYNNNDSAPSGLSWGSKMPAEENQFNYNGTYTEYFENIFKSKLASYRMEKENIGRNRTAYTFFDASGKVLVIELMPEASSAKKLRTDCKAEGVPYLRFYFDHKGWWNTRSYVEQRIDGALFS